MTVLPPDYKSLPDTTTHKPLLYLMVQTVRYLKEREDLFMDKEKSEGRVATAFEIGCDPHSALSYVCPARC